MKKFTHLKSRAIPLPLRDVDTDMIIPAQYLTSISKEGFGARLFQRLRESDPDFPLNQERFKGAKILITGDNFGCGSSREHAVWALSAWGVEAIIGTSFADIFSGNSAKNGLVLIKLDAAIVERLLREAQRSDLTLEIDLPRQTITLPSGEEQRFEFNPFRKHCIIEGLDDLDYILREREAIDKYRAQHEPLRFFNSLAPNR